MPINVNSSISTGNTENKSDTCEFARKPHLTTNYIENNIEKNIDLKKLFRKKSLPDPNSIHDAASKKYVVTLINCSSIIKTTKAISISTLITLMLLDLLKFF